MQMGSKIYELLDLLKIQQNTINKQNKLITELINENTEKENYICVLSENLKSH